MVIGPAGQLADCRAKARSWSVVAWQKCVGISRPYEVSLAYPAWTKIRRPSSDIKFTVVKLKTPRFSTAIGSNMYAKDIIIILPSVAYGLQQEAQLSPRNRAMRGVSWNLASCHATVQKLLVRQVLHQVSAVANWPARQNRAIDSAWLSVRSTVVERRSSEVL